MEANLALSNFEVKLLDESERIKTFKDWPNDLNWSCTPQKLAAAGFYYNPGPDSLDNVRCLFCQKELDGWEADDDPLKEHKKHSLKCPFLAMKKSLYDLTVTEFTRFCMKMMSLKTEKALDKIRQEFEEQSTATRKAIVEHIECTPKKK